MHLHVKCKTTEIFFKSGRDIWGFDLDKEILDLGLKHDPCKKKFITGTSSKLKIFAL